MGSCLYAQKNNVAEITNLSIDSMGDIRWTASYYESLQGLTIEVEQFRSNKWVKTGSGKSACFIPGPRWSPEQKTEKDSIRVKFHKGTTKYRLRMTVPATVISAEITFTSRVSNDDGSLWIVNNKILLDRREYYEILDHQGATIMKGDNETIDISLLPPGSYFFYTKTATRSFVK